MQPNIAITITHDATSPYAECVATMMIEIPGDKDRSLVLYERLRKTMPIGMDEDLEVWAMREIRIHSDEILSALRHVAEAGKGMTMRKLIERQKL